MRWVLTGWIVLVLGASAAAEELRFAGIFTDGAVLQRDTPAPVWGFAAPGAEVVVRFGGQAKRAGVDANGRWVVRLEAMAASDRPRVLSVESGEDRVWLKDVLVGEVWLCSGQSNMAMRVDLARDPEKEKAAADLPSLRVFTVERATSLEPMRDCEGEWVVSSPETAGDFSATAFFFGREIHREVGVPVGLIVSAWSGSAIEAWTSAEAQEAEPALAPLLLEWREKDAAYTPEVAAREQAQYEADFAAWQAAVAEAKRTGAERPRGPRKVVDPRDHWHHPTVLFNGMIAPLIPYGMKGAIWYQGETNALTEESSALYETQLPLMINDWRERWGRGDFPFAWVQLTLSSAKQVAWARIRESMRRAERLPNTANIVTWDIGEERLLHPKNKQAFGHRLALWARAEVYGEDVVWSGPRPTGHRVRAKQTVVEFESIDGGLVTQGEEGGGGVKGFELQGRDGRWHAAYAEIDGERVLVEHVGVNKPRAVRYAWKNHPD
ncbi:MAG: sialate O-acetylesterase, partial [Planctomycetota bacterium]